MDIIWVILSLVGVLGLFFIMIYAMKKLNSGLGFVNGNKMKVIDRVSVGRDSMLLVLSVAGKLMLIGVTNGHIEKLSDIDMSPEEYSASQLSPDIQQSGVNFASVMAEVLKKKKGTEKDSKND